MDKKKNLILIKGEIRTGEVVSCFYLKDDKKWKVTYQNGKTYPYGEKNVVHLKDPQVLNPNLFQIRKNNQLFSGIEGIYVFGIKPNRYWHICFENKEERDYPEEDLEIQENCLSDEKAKDVWHYLEQISHLSDLKNPDTGEKILPGRYKKTKFVGENVILAKYLGIQKQKKVTGEEFIPVFPFGCNNSQYQAVKNAMENELSVIQGPPGTGKTQTILNIIANILLQGKSVQIVSNNNSAIENVREKLESPRYELGFIAAELGKAENKKTFIERQTGKYPGLKAWRLDDESPITLESVKEKSAAVKEVFDMRERLANLRQELAQLELEVRYFQQYLSEANITALPVRLMRQMNSASFMRLWQESLYLEEEGRKAGLVFKLKNLLRYGMIDWKFYRMNIKDIIASYQKMFYEQRNKELEEEISEITEKLERTDKNLMEDLTSDSMKLLKDQLAKKYAGKDVRPVFTEDDLWKNADKVLDEYPVILSTTFSSSTSLGNGTIYDYVIVDEASQVDIATGALALSRARCAVIVGDTKQLPNVVTDNDRKNADAIFESFDLSEGYRFTKSFLQSVIEVVPDVVQTLLREHYRCHPKIIDFCNQKFYRGELVIMTEDHGEKDVLAAVRTVKGNHVRDHYSQRQIDVIREEVIPKYVTAQTETGIIAPYNKQVEALQREFPEIEIATVHKFQGREKDTIILSTVDDVITDFADDPYLLNVAVSRAKKRLMLVVSGNEQDPKRNISDLVAYIQYHNFEVLDSKVYSVFDYLYQQYTKERREYLSKHSKVSEYDSENLMYARIKEILSEEAYASLDVLCHFPLSMLIRDLKRLDDEELRYVQHPASHVDFLIFNRISKQYVLAIEVDGVEYHKAGSEQAERDIKKNQILEKYNLPLMRFATKGSMEMEKIRKALADSV